MAVDQLREDAQRPERTRARSMYGYRAGLAALLAYLLGAAVLYLPLVRHLRSAEMGGPDTSLFTWWLAWTPWAITHGHSPLVSTWINAPVGVNMMWNTSVPLLGVVMAPVTWTLGPVASVNLLLVAAPALCAWSAYLAGRLLGLRVRSAFLVGFLYGFSTHVIAENSSGHLHLSIAVFPPLVAALLYRIVTATISPRRGGLLLGLAALLQVWVSEELLATSGILAALTLAILAVRTPPAVVLATVRRLALATAWALLVVLPLASPALYVQFFGAGHLSSGLPVDPWSTDVLTSVTPTRQALVGTLVSDRTMQRIQVSDYDEITGYIGLPLIVLLIACRGRIRATAQRWCWVPLLVACVLTLGWTVRVGGLNTGIPGPGQLVARWPVLQNIVLARFALYIVLFAALLAGAAWDTAVSVRARRWIGGLVVLTVAAVLPLQSAHIRRFHDPGVFTGGGRLPGLADGATAAALPWPTSGDAVAMRWQAEDRMRFKLLGLWGVVAAADGSGAYGTPRPELDRVSRALRHDPDDHPAAGSAEERALLAELTSWGRTADVLLVGPGGTPIEGTDTGAVAGYLGTLLHQRPVLTGGVYVFRLPGH